MTIVLGWRASPKTVSVTFDDGIPHVISNDHPKFVEIGAKLNAGDYDGIADMISPADIIKTYLNGKIEVKANSLFYKGEQVNLAIVPTIMELIAEDKDPTVLLLFLDRLMQNPSYRSRNQLWAFVEKNGIVLYSGGRIFRRDGTLFDPKGWLVLYKGVRNDYRDLHTGKFDNSVGAHQSMPRSEVDDDPNAACSSGFHAGDFAYVKGFGDRKMVVLVDPADVGSIPHDSNWTKLRTCAYDVIGEVPREEFKDFESCTYGEAPEDSDEARDDLDEDVGIDERAYEIQYADRDAETVSAVDVADALTLADTGGDIVSITELAD